MPISVLRPAALGLLLALPAHSVTAQTETPAPSSRPGFFDVFTFENLTTRVMQTLLSSARVFADIRYQDISVDPIASRITLLDLDVRPHLPGFAPDACAVTAARVTFAGQPLDRLEATRLRVAFDDVNVGMGCLPAEVRAMAFGIGLQQITVPRMDMGMHYDFASGGATFDISADIEKVAAIELFMDADYISLRMDPETEEPRPALDLNMAHLTIDDRGGWAMATQVLPREIQTAEAFQQIIAGAVASALTEANGLAAPQLSDAQQRFTAEAGALAAAFIEGERRIVLSTAIADGPLRLDESSASEFQPLFDALSPTLTAVTPQLTTVVAVADLQAAMNSEPLPDNALEMGRAMLTGVGTPRNINAGLSMLARASRADNAEAAYLVAKALATKDPATAYGHALRAAAAKVPGAMAVLDLAERGTPYEVMIQLQNDAGAGPDPALYDSVIGMRQAARGFLNGIGHYRSYRGAFYWASMAAAAGDASGVAMRDEIEELMRLRGDEAAWAKEIETLENGVMRDWIKHDVPGRLQ